MNMKLWLIGIIAGAVMGTTVAQDTPSLEGRRERRSAQTETQAETPSARPARGAWAERLEGDEEITALMTELRTLRASDATDEVKAVETSRIRGEIRELMGQVERPPRPDQPERSARPVRPAPGSPEEARMNELMTQLRAARAEDPPNRERVQTLMAQLRELRQSLQPATVPEPEVVSEAQEEGTRMRRGTRERRESDAELRTERRRRTREE